MKKIEKIYFILTYMFFIYPPFIFGLVAIYQKTDAVEEHITSLIVNIILIAVIALVCGALIMAKKLHIPNSHEIKYLLFGFTGNIVMYFYTFQNGMNIDNFVTIYLILLVVLTVDFLLISKKFRVKELWILLTLFLVVDYVHLLITGCGYTEAWECDINHAYDWLATLMYSIVLITIVGYYAYRTYSYKLYDLFKILNIIFVILLAIIFQNQYYMEGDFMLTVSILLPFFLIVDFIVAIVNKTYTHKMLLFYIRSLTVLMVFSIVGMNDFFLGNVDVNMLIMMVVVTYSSLAINILKPILKIDVKEDKPLQALKQVFSGLHYIECTEAYKEMIKEQYSKKQYDHILLDSSAYSLVAIIDDKIVGFISTYIKHFSPPLEGMSEGYINILEVHEEFRKQGIATRLIEKTERYFKQTRVSQIRGWSSDDKLEAINLWNELKYSLSPTTIWIEDKKVSVKGYHFIKKLK